MRGLRQSRLQEAWIHPCASRMSTLAIKLRPSGVTKARFLPPVTRGVRCKTNELVAVNKTVVRGWLPERFRPHITAGLLLSWGALIVDPNGVDFTLIKPQSLAIGLFVLLPGLYGYYVAKAVDRLLHRPLGRLAPWVGIVLAFHRGRASWHTVTISAFDTPNLCGLTIPGVRGPPGRPQPCAAVRGGARCRAPPLSGNSAVGKGEVPRVGAQQSPVAGSWVSSRPRTTTRSSRCL